MIEEAIYAHLSTSTALTAIVSNRIYPIMMPQEPTIPAVTYQRVSNVHINAISGACGLDNIRIQIDCWTTSYSAAKTLGDVLRKAMASAPFTALQLSDEDIYDPDTEIYSVSMDYSCWYHST